MSLRNRFILPFLLSVLAALAGCGNGSPKAVAPPGGGFSNSNLSGTYVFSVSGVDVQGSAFAMLGALDANGSGGITGGTIDVNDEIFAVSTPVIAPISNSPIGGNSSYSVGVDGRGTANISTSTPFGTIKFAFVLTSGSHGLITQFDGNASGCGSLDLQSSGVTQSSLAGSYAYSFSGVDASGASPLATVGAFALDAGGNISPGVADFNDGGFAYPAQPLGGQVVLGPGTASQLASTSFGLTFDVYAIDANHLKFIEMDSTPIVSGDAFSQSSATIPSGTMAFTLAGSFQGSPASAGGFMVSDGNGNITSSSTEDASSAASGTTSAPIPFSASYTSTGSGRFTLGNFASFFGGTLYAAYPSDGGLLLLEIDDAGLLVGAAYPQSSVNFAASEGYGLNLSGFNPNAGVEVDDVAEFTAASGGTLTGILDENFDPGGAPLPNLAFSNGTFGAIDTNGRFGVSANVGTGNNTSLNGGFNLTLYSVDGTTFPFIESDGGQIATGVIVEQSTPTAAAAAMARGAKARPQMFIVRAPVLPKAARAQLKLQKKK